MPPVENILLALINRLLLCLVMRQQQQHLQIWEVKTSDELSISLTGNKVVWHSLPSLQI